MSNEQRANWVEVFSALANEKRIKIVEMLTSGKLECQEILDRLDLSQPAVSYHLGKLERAGILTKEKHGSRNCYRLKKSIYRLIETLKKEEKE
jgi:DNA-binding transcriptional ArsR family regulator